MVSVQPPSSNSRKQFVVTTQHVLYFALCGMSSFGLFALLAPEWFHIWASANDVPADLSYLYHFGLRELFMGIMFGVAASSAKEIPKSALQNYHRCGGGARLSVLRYDTITKVRTFVSLGLLCEEISYSTLSTNRRCFILLAMTLQYLVNK